MKPDRRACRTHRAALCAAAVLLCGLVAMDLPAPLFAADEPEYRGRRVVDVLRELQDRGLELIFSSAVVGKDLRVTVEPAGSEPRAILDEILSPLGLKAAAGPGGAILIVPLSSGTGILKGHVHSMIGGKPIAAASVRLPETGDSATSDADGFFEIRLIPAGTYEVNVSALGFSTVSVAQVRIDPDNDAELAVELRAQPSFVTQVVVTPSRRSIVRQEQAARHTITNDEAVLVPTIGGDITRVVELLPGVTAADNSAAFNVRGSLASDVSLVLDGLELYDPFHMQSFQSPFSLIDSNVVDRIDFFGGGFTADFGDRHGGFVELSTLGPGEPGRGELELGSLNTRLSYRTPMSKRSGSWLVSVRTWYPEAVVDATELGGGENLDPRFSDAYAKAVFNLSPRHQLSTHGLVAFDRLTFLETDEELNEAVDAEARRGYLWLRLLSAWSKDVTSETILSGGRIDRNRSGIAAEDELITVNDDRVVDFYGVKHDSIWQISDTHVLKTGAHFRWLNARYRYSNEFSEDPLASTSLELDPDGTSLGAYVAYRARVSSKLATEVGARWDRQTYTRDNQISPRFNAMWRPSERSELRLAVGRFNQSHRIHELRVEDGETEFGPAEVADQAELSLQHGFRTGLRLRLDAYYKRLSRLRPRYENLFEPVELFPETTEDRVLVAPDRARLRGVEILLRGAPGPPLFWWVSYTLSSAKDVVDGRDVPRSWDQPHAGKFLISYSRDDRWSISLSGSAHTGWPTTPVSGEIVIEDGMTVVEEVWGERNSDRFSGYARFDLKARKSFPLTHGRLWLTLEVINLTDRNNACCLDEAFFEILPDNTVETTRAFDYWLGITPSFSLLWEF